MTKKKLDLVVDDFTEKMRARLRDKAKAGFTGWDDPDWDSCDLYRRMQSKVTEVLVRGNNCDPKHLVDIANFAMFLHFKLDESEGA